jgi:hypothetical protein
MGMGSFGVVAIPFGVAGLVALEPLEEPVLRPAQLLINKQVISLAGIVQLLFF